MSRINEIDDGGVRGYIHHPDQATGEGLVLTHGAGSNCRTPVLVELADAACALGVTVIRCDLPYRQRRAYGAPLPAGAAADRAGIHNAAATLRGMIRGPVFIGGHSYGGRQASMLAAEEHGVAAGLLLLSYPLHPPAKPADLRVQHFPSLRTPVIFVHGTKDKFATPAELMEHTAVIPAPKRLMFLEGAGHELGRNRVDMTAVMTQLREWSAR